MGTEGMNPEIADINFSVNTTSSKCMAESKMREKIRKELFPAL